MNGRPRWSPAFRRKFRLFEFRIFHVGGEGGLLPSTPSGRGAGGEGGFLRVSDSIFRFRIFHLGGGGNLLPSTSGRGAGGEGDLISTFGFWISHLAGLLCWVLRGYDYFRIAGGGQFAAEMFS